MYANGISLPNWLICVCVNMHVEYIELPAVCVMLCHSLVSRLMGDTRLWQPPPLIFWGQKKTT